MAGIEVELVDLCTNERRRAILVGFDITELDTDTLSTVYGYITRSAETDLTLPRVDYNHLRYATPEFTNTISSPAVTNTAQVIIGRLQVYGDLLENQVENDPGIRESDEVIIRGAFGHDEEGVEQTDAPQLINFAVIQDHLLTVLQRFFSRERVAKSSATRLLIDFALIIKYCYSFLKRLVEHARLVLHAALQATLPQIAFDILCRVTSAIFSHLVQIQWTSVLQQVGGWVGLASTGGLTMVMQNQLSTNSKYQVFFGISLLSAVLGAYYYYYKT